MGKYYEEVTYYTNEKGHYDCPLSMLQIIASAHTNKWLNKITNTKGHYYCPMSMLHIIVSASADYITL